MLIKSQLIGELSKHFPHLPEKDIALAVNHIIDHMSDVLSNGGRIEIRGFGSFNLHFRPSRRAHNPKTGEKLVTSPKYAAHFKPGKELRESVNNNKHVAIEKVSKEDLEDETE
jgi:integration host factor subunit beta